MTLAGDRDRLGKEVAVIVIDPLILDALAVLFLGLVLLGLVFFGRALVKRGVRKDTLVNLAMWLLMPLLVVTLALAASCRMRNRTPDDGPATSEVVEEAASWAQ
jgi:hypothetical protein